jgi:hypothetical protein
VEDYVKPRHGATSVVSAEYLKGYKTHRGHIRHRRRQSRAGQLRRKTGKGKGRASKSGLHGYAACLSQAIGASRCSLAGPADSDGCSRTLLAPNTTQRTSHSCRDCTQVACCRSTWPLLSNPSKPRIVRDPTAPRSFPPASHGTARTLSFEWPDSALSRLRRVKCIRNALTEVCSSCRTKNIAW